MEALQVHGGLMVPPNSTAEASFLPVGRALSLNDPANPSPVATESLPTTDDEDSAPQRLLAPVALLRKPGTFSTTSSSESLAPATPATEDAAEDGSLQLASAGAQRFAYVTLLTRDGYLKGVQGLARSLRAANSRHPLLVMYTPDTLPSAAVDALLQEGCQMLAVERYMPPGHHDFGQYKMQLYAECWTKLRMWELEHYDRLVYLDADMIVTRNIDHLFSLPPGFYAAPDCTAGRKTQAERDSCPLFCPHQPHYFNAGFFLMSPSRAEMARFNSLLAAGAVQIGGYAEQDFLNEVYKSTWQALPHTYNAQKGIQHHHPELWRQHWLETAIIHYTDAKPWHKEHPEHAKHADIVQLWWQVFEGNCPASGRQDYCQTNSL